MGRNTARPRRHGPQATWPDYLNPMLARFPWRVSSGKLLLSILLVCALLQFPGQGQALALVGETTGGGLKVITWDSFGVVNHGGGTSPYASGKLEATGIHKGISASSMRNCVACHQAQARNNLHVRKKGIQCAQCHGKSPAFGVDDYSSPVNPIKRHIYVCAKCHDNANAAFASYVIHEPPPFAKETATTFPEMFFVTWMLLVIAVATFAFFLPHTVLWFIRELLLGKRMGEKP